MERLGAVERVATRPHMVMPLREARKSSWTAERPVWRLCHNHDEANANGPQQENDDGGILLLKPEATEEPQHECKWAGRGKKQAEGGPKLGCGVKYLWVCAVEIGNAWPQGKRC